MMMLFIMRLKVCKPGGYGTWLLCLTLMCLIFSSDLGLEIPKSYRGRGHSEKLVTSASETVLPYQKAHHKLLQIAHQTHKQHMVSDKDDQSLPLKSPSVISAAESSSFTRHVSASSGADKPSHSQRVQGTIKEANKNEGSVVEFPKDRPVFQASHHNHRAGAQSPCCWQGGYGGDGSHNFGVCQNAPGLWTCPPPPDSPRLFTISLKGLEVSDLSKDLAFFQTLKRLPRHLGTEVSSESSESAFFSDQAGALMVSLVKYLGVPEASSSLTSIKPAFSLKFHSSY